MSAQGDGCPAAAKIGTLTVKTPIFEDDLSGDIYLAQPNDPATPTPGAENPFDSLVAVYLLAKAPQRGVMVKLAGQLRLDPGHGTVTAVFDGLPATAVHGPRSELPLRAALLPGDAPTAAATSARRSKASPGAKRNRSKKKATR